MLKVEVDRAKKLVRRISSIHYRGQPPSADKATGPVPQKAPARNFNQAAQNVNNLAAKPSDIEPTVVEINGEESPLKDLVQAATSQQLREFDQGIFSLSLIRNDIYPRDLSCQDPKSIDKAEVQEGSFEGTKRAITQAYNKIESRFATYYDAVNFEPSLPQDRDLKERNLLYQYQLPTDKHSFPPCLAWIPPQVRVGQAFGPGHLFDHMRLLDTATILDRIIPATILNWLHDDPESKTFRGIENKELALRKKRIDIFNQDNIGCRKDWYTDAVFAQQQFTGANPTTLTHASAYWISEFKSAAKAQGNVDAERMLNDEAKTSFYVQDCSYFRAAVEVANDSTIQDEQGKRFLCATVTLYRLNEQGVLHPLSIIIDYKGSAADSVVIFNKRLCPSAPTESEGTDWPWRYAKMCAQAADWTRHELTIHLTNAHLVEEAVIVACNRVLPSTHVLYKLLQPHWYKTLSLNAAARTTLVPSVIVPIAGMTKDNVYQFINHAYKSFDWPSLNIPTDLSNRGFPISEIPTSPKYHNYAYGRDILLMWQALHKFVKSVLELAYHNDSEVVGDRYVQELAKEIRSPEGGQLYSFPELKSISALADAVTMMIHIASPQHTAVNYTQDYYMSFLPNKPTCLYAPPPETLIHLMKYQEKDLIAALPIHRSRDWLLATHLPHLLSYRVADEQNLVTYAVSLSKVADSNGQYELAKAAAQLWSDLIDCGRLFDMISNELDDRTKPYDVLMPQDTAVSILI